MVKICGLSWTDPVQVYCLRLKEKISFKRIQ